MFYGPHTRHVDVRYTERVQYGHFALLVHRTTNNNSCKRIIFHVTVRRTTFLIIEPNRCTISQNYFVNNLYIFRTVRLSIIRT